MMPKIFLGVSLPFILGTAVLGFLTKGNVTQVKSEKQALEVSLVALQGDLKKSQDEVKAAATALEETNKKLEATTAEIAKKQTDVETNTAKVTEIQAIIAAKDKEIEELKAKPPVTIQDPEAVSKLADATEKLHKAETELAEAKQVTETLNAKIKQQEGEFENFKKEKERRDRQVMVQGLEGQVLAVNQAWNFAVINIGDKQGAVMNAELVVKRDSNMIARVRISSVEPATAIADIIPGSMQPNMRVQPGDKVIYVGN